MARCRRRADRPRRGWALIWRSVIAIATSTADPQLLDLDEIQARIDTVLQRSAADETELVWLELRRGFASARGNRCDVRITPERAVLVRVLDLGRVGSFRTGSAEIAELESAVRMAMAQSRSREPLAGLPHLPADDEPLGSTEGLYDPAVAKLSARKVRSLAQAAGRRRETVSLRWAEARVAVCSTRKVRRQAVVTAIEGQVRCGRRPGAGRAGDASRRLADLDLERIAERARERHGRGGVEEPPAGPLPVVVAPEAAVELVDLLSQISFSAKAYYDGTSFLREHLGVQVFDRGLDLRDDGTDPAGIPFPFDLEGTAKRPVHLILKGAPKTPTLDQRQAAVLGLPPTAHAIGGNDARAGHLFLEPGERSQEELLAGAEGGLWIGWLDQLECYEHLRVQFRGRARGVRRIEAGKLGRPVADLIWQDSLLRAFSNLAGLGSDTVRRLGPDGFLGGISAPAVGLAAVEGLTL